MQKAFCSHYVIYTQRLHLFIRFNNLRKVPEMQIYKTYLS